MTENQHLKPSFAPNRTNLHGLAHLGSVILPAGLVALGVVALGALTGYWLSFAEEHPEDKQGVIIFFMAAGSIIGLGCGYLTARVLCNAIPAAYASSGIVVIALALLLIRNPNHMGAARLIACLTLAGFILLNAVVFAARRMQSPVDNPDSQEEARTN